MTVVVKPGRQRRAPDDAYRRAMGEHVRQLREDRALSQQALANAADMSVRHLGGIERGTANTSVDVLVRIADQLGVQPSALLPDRHRHRTNSGH